MEPIGYQDGITAFNDWFTKMGLWQRAFERWAMLSNESRAQTRPPIPPAIPGRGPNYSPSNLTTWPWPEKHERTERKLKDWHDASASEEPNKPPPVAQYKKVAPITVREEGGSDQRVCLFNPDGSLRPGVSRLPTGEYTDESGAKYASDADGLENTSVRTKVHDERLVGARSMDGRSACQCPPVGSPHDNSGSWTV